MKMAESGTDFFSDGGLTMLYVKKKSFSKDTSVAQETQTDKSSENQATEKVLVMKLHQKWSADKSLVSLVC